MYVHYNVKTAEDKLLQSTYSQEGGAGLPHPFIVGGGRRVPRAWEIAMLSECMVPRPHKELLHGVHAQQAIAATHPFAEHAVKAVRQSYLIASHT